MRTEITSIGFGQITGIGTVNPENRIAPRTTRSKRVEVLVKQDRRNTPINVEILVPVQRSERGSRRVAALNLNGSQARELYETLAYFFEEVNQNTTLEERNAPSVMVSE
jgi:hypothetical protein